jgi:hypothetical protein
MGIDIHGWVEVSHLDPDERAEESAWAAIISVDSVIDTCDEVSQLLFGFSKHALSGGQLPYIPIALNRGIPPNPSDEVQRSLNAIEAHERQFDPGECRGYTHIDFSETEAVEWRNYGVTDPESSDWWVLFRMIRLLSSDHRFANAGFRIVCWVSW